MQCNLYCICFQQVVQRLVLRALPLSYIPIISVFPERQAEIYEAASLQVDKNGPPQLVSMLERNYSAEYSLQQRAVRIVSSFFVTLTASTSLPYLLNQRPTAGPSGVEPLLEDLQSPLCSGRVRPRVANLASLTFVSTLKALRFPDKRLISQSGGSLRLLLCPA